jgi:transposase
LSLDKLIPEDYLVRVTDLRGDRIDLGRLGMAKVQLKSTMRTASDPADLTKLYLYGYLNQICSLRTLELKAGSCFLGRTAGKRSVTD